MKQQHAYPWIESDANKRTGVKVRLFFADGKLRQTGLAALVFRLFSGMMLGLGKINRKD
jgi:hypothetical protein